jgi:hypothetical protein
MAIPVSQRSWPRDLKLFGALCTLWAALLIVRVVAGPFSSHSQTFQDVFLGIKFFDGTAQITMTIQAVIYAAFGIGIVLRRRWGVMLGLVYFVEVVIGHIIFFYRNVNVPSEAIHVKITAIGVPIMGGILLYLWFRGRPLLR